MELDIGEALEQGLNRTATKTAAYLTGLLFVVNIVSKAMSDTVAKNLVQSGVFRQPVEEFLRQQLPRLAPLATGLSSPVAGAVLLIAGLGSTAVTIGAVRAFIEERTEGLSADLFTERFAWTLLNLLVGGIVFGLAVGIGMVALVIPGIFLFTVLYLWNFYVIDRGENFIEAMKSSWNVTEGNRLRLLILIVIVLVGTGLFSTAAGVLLGLTRFVAGNAAGAALRMIPTSLAAVYALASFTEAYKQFSEPAEEESGEDE